MPTRTPTHRDGDGEDGYVNGDVDEGEGDADEGVDVELGPP